VARLGGLENGVNVSHHRFDSGTADFGHGQRLQALGTLSAALVHEMNNLLTPILGYARLALHQPEDAELQHKALTRTHDAAERAVKVCAAVMSLARSPETTDICPHRACVGEAVHAAATLVGWTAADSDTRFTATAEPSSLVVGIAPGALEQVLVNLMQNARRAMGPGGAVTANTYRNPVSGEIELTLRDSGPGVPQDRAAVLFEPFVTDSATCCDDENPGTGLGLWISKALLESVGGGIELVPNDPNQPGACFRLRLPGCRDEQDADRRAA